MSVEISVICLTYNSDENKLLTTLNSVIQQKNCKYEIIIADDGSKDNKFEEVESFFAAKYFQNYKLIANEENKGIIKNFLSAIKLAKGKYIKYISPGDYLYDEYTLEYFCDFMNKYEAPIAFGKAVYYSDDSHKLTIYRKMSPVITKNYEPSQKNYDYSLVLRKIMLYGDPILGAAIVANKNEFEYYLEEIKDKVTYIEDNTILPLLTLDKKRIYYMDRYILWYEYKSGISTSGNKEFEKKIKLDFYNCYRYIAIKYPNDTVVKLGYLMRKYIANNNKIMASIIKRIIDLRYGRMFYRINRRITIKNIDVSSINKENYYKLTNLYIK